MLFALTLITMIINGQHDAVHIAVQWGSGLDQLGQAVRSRITNPTTLQDLRQNVVDELLFQDHFQACCQRLLIYVV